MSGFLSISSNFCIMEIPPVFSSCCLGCSGRLEKESGGLWLLQAVTACPGTGTDNNTLGYLHFLATNDTGLPAQGSAVEKEIWESMSEFPPVLELLGSL